jgi:predicted  nucleic acid-binding Zn-ribbon protein
MFDKNTMPTEDLLRAFRGILAFSMRKDHPEYEKLTKDIPFARKTIDKFINQLLKKFEDEKEYQKELEEYEKSMREYEKEMEEYNRKMKEWQDYQRSKGNQTQAQPQSQQELDYSTMGKSDLQKLLNKALENGDFETVKKIRPYL